MSKGNSVNECSCSNAIIKRVCQAVNIWSS